MLTQTIALLVDAYRELNARKMFWITLLISTLVVGVFAAFGVSESGLTFLWWEFRIPGFGSETVPPHLFYKAVFAQLGIPIWLTWAATILALISTASIIPDFVAGGTIELALARPIGRLRLFLVKYATGLLFVALQVLFFTGACFLVIGLRGDSWEPRLFLAVPIVVLFFSYLYCICALVGLLTRSTIAAILLTILAWLGLFAVNTTDGLFIHYRERAALQCERLERRVQAGEDLARRELERRAQAGQPVRDEDGTLPPGAADELEAVNPLLRGLRERLEESRRTHANLDAWSRRVTAIKTIVPKTQETIGLLERSLLSAEDQTLFFPQRDDRPDPTADVTDNDPELVDRLIAATRARSTAWILGTSLAFEAAVLAACCWVFCRRDF